MDKACKNCTFADPWGPEDQEPRFECKKFPDWKVVPADHWCHSFMKKSVNARPHWQICTSCGEEKTFRFFYTRMNRGVMKRLKMCKECTLKKARVYRENYDKRKPWAEVNGKP